MENYSRMMAEGMVPEGCSLDCYILPMDGKQRAPAEAVGKLVSLLGPLPTDPLPPARSYSLMVPQPHPPPPLPGYQRAAIFYSVHSLVLVLISPRGESHSPRQDKQERLLGRRIGRPSCLEAVREAQGTAVTPQGQRWMLW